MSKLNQLAMNSLAAYLTWKVTEPQTISEIATAMAVSKESIRYPLACLVREGRLLVKGTPYAYYVPGKSGPVRENDFLRAERVREEILVSLASGPKTLNTLLRHINCPPDTMLRLLHGFIARGEVTVAIGNRDGHRPSRPGTQCEIFDLVRGVGESSQESQP